VSLKSEKWVYKKEIEGLGKRGVLVKCQHILFGSHVFEMLHLTTCPSAIDSHVEDRYSFLLAAFES
jgi:hypothetical protein